MKVKATSVKGLPSDVSVAKILIVDDDPQLRQMLELALAMRGHEIVETHNGAEALQRIHMERPDLVLLDLQMPGMDGLQTCRAIRAGTETLVRTVPIIVVSLLDRREEAMAAGANDFVRKPFGIEDLILRIDAALV